MDERLRLDEVNQQPPSKIRRHEGAENHTVGMGFSVPTKEYGAEDREEQNFVELRRMAWDSVAEIYAPGKRRGVAVSVVGETREKTADAADGDANAERYSEEVSRTRADADEALHDFHGQPAAQQAADDGLAAGDEELVPVPAVARGLLQQAENAAAGERADGDCGDDEPAALVGERVALTAAHMPVDEVAADVSEDLEDGVQRGMEDTRQALVSVQSSHSGRTGKSTPSAQMTNVGGTTSRKDRTP